MRKWLLGCLLACTAAAAAGCITPIYSSDPPRRARQLLFSSESMRHVPDIWERIWFLDAPDQATPFRVHGGII